MGLKTYYTKRNFANTPEPKKSLATAKGQLKFVVQRHDASHLHYDFRLEMEGVLKSWAVPKGPSMNPTDKRLAMMVEDHPFSYRTFEGVIPSGNYGAGTVEIWDEGTYQAVGATNKKESEKLLLQGLKKGDIKFIIRGSKLNGEFALVKIKNSSGKDNAWLLIKKKDTYALNKPYNSEDYISAESKIINKPKQTKVTRPKNQSLLIPKGAISAKMPHEVKPMLAKLTDKAFDHPDWIYEIKWDGYRAIAEVEKGKIKLYSRNNLSFNTKYPALVQALGNMHHTVVLDGEVAVLDKEGHARFQLIQNFAENGGDLVYYVYDLLYLDGYDLRDLPLIERKKILQELLKENIPNVFYSDHVMEKGVSFYKQAEKLGIEGIIAKKADSPYRTGVRSGEWLKIKTEMRQEAVIAGFTDPRGGRKHFGALILGVYDKGEFKYVGHSGGGFDHAALKEVRSKLTPLIQEESPFKEKIKTNSPVTWLKPKLVCEISFSEWTGDGHMRHPIFMGLRDDKDPKKVTKEKPEAHEKLVKNTGRTANGKNKITKMTVAKKTISVPEITGDSKETELKIGRNKVKLTNLHKVYWPDEGYTKKEVIVYYQQMAKYILPYLKNRPESLHRHPNGINALSFYHKDMRMEAPNWVHTENIFSESNNKDVNYLVCQNKETLAYMNNLGCIEINPWNSRLKSLDKPDYVVIDLDPGENTFSEVIETALVVKEILDRAGAKAYCKTSGATGMHIYIPLGAKYLYEQARDFAHVIAQIAHERLPKLTSLERSPKSRRKKIYLDYLQNSKGQTLAAVYSVRPKPGATISTPLSWKELKEGLHPSQFTIETIHKRVEKVGDLFQDVLGKGIDIKKCLKKLSV